MGYKFISSSTLQLSNSRQALTFCEVMTGLLVFTEAVTFDLHDLSFKEV